MNDYLPALLKELQESQPELSLGLLSECVNQLTKLEKAAIMYQITKNRSAEILLTTLYLESSYAHFDIWVSELYLKAINTLTNQISEILDNL
jgi:hypothetical protein